MNRLFIFLILFILVSCVLNNNDDDTIYVLKTIKTYDSNNNLTEIIEYTLYGRSITSDSQKMTYNSNGYCIEEIYYDDSGLQSSRTTTSYQLLIDDIYVPKTINYYDEHDLFTSSVSYSVNGLNVKHSNSVYTFRTTYDSTGNIIEYYVSNKSGEQTSRVTMSYQLLTGDIYVLKTQNSFDSNDSLYLTHNFTISNMSVTEELVGFNYPTSKKTYNKNGKIIEYVEYYNNSGNQNYRKTYTWQLMTLN